MWKRQRTRSDPAAPVSNGGTDGNHLEPRVREEIIAYLREWLPRRAARTYREMISADPAGWSADPHFQGGIIVEHALRGNGITEEVLGVESLEAVWPELLRLAVEAPGTARADEND